MKHTDDTIELFRDLSIRIGVRTLVDRQSLSVERGKIAVLTGASGVGKSILADVVFATRTVPGLAVEGTVGEARERGALVFQAGGGIAHLDVRENLLLVRADRARAEELIKRFALPATQRPGELSGGQRRRLAVACALLAERELLWLDEPEAGLDVARVADLTALLKEQAAIGGSALVVATHDLDFASAIADHVVHLGPDGLLEELEGRSAQELRADLMRRLTAHAGAPDRGHAGGRRRTGPFAPIEWLAHLATNLLYAWAVLGGRAARRTFAETLRLAAWDGVLFYPFIGAIFGGIFILIFQITVPPAVDTAKILSDFGPTIVMRFSPPFAALLVAACAGSTVSSWLGQMTLARDLATLEVLNVSVTRHVGAPAWWGLALASAVSTITFALAVTGVFAVYIALYAPSGSESLGEFRAGFAEGLHLEAALLKACGLGALLATITTACASAPKHGPEDVASSVTQGIVWSSIVIVSAELSMLILDHLGGAHLWRVRVGAR